jgi:hypothetical protein
MLAVVGSVDRCSRSGMANSKFFTMDGKTPASDPLHSRSVLNGLVENPKAAKNSP